MRFFSILLLGCGVLILGMTGCGGGGADQPDLVPVSGTVKLEGQPAPGIAVMFFPVGVTRGTTYYANTDSSGLYTLQASNGQQGAPVGEYKVTCSKYAMPDGAPFTSDGTESPEMAGAKELLPPRFSNQSQTELKATVPTGGGTIDFEVTTK
jgi:hypothetical protein